MRFFSPRKTLILFVGFLFSISIAQAQVDVFEDPAGTSYSGYPVGTLTTKLRVGDKSGAYATNNAVFEAIGASSGLAGSIYIGRSTWNEFARLGITGADATNRGLALNIGDNATNIGIYPGNTVARFFFSRTGRMGINDIQPEVNLSVYQETNPAIQVKSLNNGRLQIAVASAAANYAGVAQANDAVLRKLGYGDLILDIPTTQETGTKAVVIADDDDKILTAWNGGKVHIGPDRAYADIDVSGYRLFVEEGILTEKIKVELEGDWADYVFESDYELMSIAEMEAFTLENKRLPNIPSEAELAEDGVNLLEITKLQQEKIEELSLYIFQLNKRLEELEAKELKEQN